MNWTDYTRGFCEGVVGIPIGPIREPANAFSSLFLVFFGLLGIIQSPRAPLIIQFLYGMLFYNGIGSFFFHAFWQIGWATIDVFTMFLALSMGVWGLADSLSNEFKYSYQKLAPILALFFNGILIFSLTLSRLGIRDDYFQAIIFSLYLSSIIVIICLFHLEAIHKELKKLFFISVPLMILGYAIWFVCETLCVSIIMAYGHVIWHILLSYGSYVLITVGSYSNAIKYRQSQITFIILCKFIPIVLWYAETNTTTKNSEVSGHYKLIKMQPLMHCNTFVDCHTNWGKCFRQLNKQYNLSEPEKMMRRSNDEMEEHRNQELSKQSIQYPDIE